MANICFKKILLCFCFSSICLCRQQNIKKKSYYEKLPSYQKQEEDDYENEEDEEDEEEEKEEEELYFFVEKTETSEEEKNEEGDEPNHVPENKYKQPFSKNDLITKQKHENKETWLSSLNYKNLENTIQKKPPVIENPKKHSYLFKEDIKTFFEPLHINITSKQKHIIMNFSGIIFDQKYEKMKKNIDLYTTLFQMKIIDFSEVIISPNFDINLIVETNPEIKKILYFDESQLNFLKIILQQDDLSYLDYVEEIGIGISQADYGKMSEKASKIFKELGELTPLISKEQNEALETYINYNGNKISLNFFFQKNMKFVDPTLKYVIIEGIKPEVFFNKDVLIEKEDIDHILYACKNYSDIIIDTKNLRIPAAQILEIIEIFWEEKKKVSLLLSQKSFFDLVKMNPDALLALSYIEVFTNDDIKLLKKTGQSFDLGDIECHNLNVSGFFIEYREQPIKINISKQTDFILT